MSQLCLIGTGVALAEKVSRAVAVFRENEPAEGYYGAFSGGKDSCTIKKLAELAGVRIEWWYNNTTIDPPELIRFIKSDHPDVRWHSPRHGNMLHRIETAPKVPPTRRVRWCCDEYKEWGGDGRFKVIGVRQEESKARQAWREVAEDLKGNPVLCPIVHWTTEDVWEFLRSYSVPYCALYDEGWTRLGCVGCPLNNQARDREFLRWPKYAEKWKKAVIGNWERWKDVPRKRDGKPRTQAHFKSGEEFWQWYIGDHHGKDIIRECQGGKLWTNEAEENDDMGRI